MGVDAVEPDVVVSADGVLVVRHENEISETTDVADRPDFADRRTTRTVDGQRLTGWFTEDFTWEELSTLRCRERLPALRPDSAAFDDTEPILRLRDVLDLVRQAAPAATRPLGVVVEIKHPTYFTARGWDVAALVRGDLEAAEWVDDPPGPLVIESFEQSVLDALEGVPATRVYLLEADGAAADLVARRGADAPSYTAQLHPAGLDELAGAVHGISVPKRRLLAPSPGEPRDLVADAHARGLLVYTWTCRPENAFLLRPFRTAGGPAAHGDVVGEWTRLRELGVDGVFVDHPDLGVRVFRDGPGPAPAG